MPLYSKEENEKSFVKFFLKGETINVIDEYQRVAEVLKSQGCRKTLIDDAGGFPVVVFFGNPKAFYLPYMYEYFAVLSYPKAFADCVVIDKERCIGHCLFTLSQGKNGNFGGLLFDLRGQEVKCVFQVRIQVKFNPSIDLG
jgi:hypothetical protein